MELEAKLATLEEERARDVEVSSEKDEIATINQEIQVEMQSQELCEINKEKEGLTNEIRVMVAKNEELIAALEEREKMVQELQEKLHSTLEEKDKIIEKLESELASRDENINILEKAKAGEEAKLVEKKQFAEQRIIDMRVAEQRIVELEKEMCSMKEDHAAAIKCLEKELSLREESLKRKNDAESAKVSDEILAKLEEDMSRIKEQKEKEVGDLRKVIEHRDKKILSLEEIMAKNEKLLAEMDTHAEELRKKDSDITALREEINKLASSQGEECHSLREELKSRDEQLEMLERSLKDCKVELKSKNTQLMAVKKVQGTRPSTPTKSRQNNLVKQLEKRLEESTAALDKKNSQLISKNNAIAKLENTLKELRADLRRKEREMSELQDNIKQLTESKEGDKNDTINELNIQLREQQNNLLNKTKEKDEVEENLRFVEGELQILSSKEKETLEEMRKLTKERDELKDEVQKLKSEVEKHEKAECSLNKQLETQAGLAKQHECQIEVRNFYLIYNMPFVFFGDVSFSRM